MSLSVYERSKGSREEYVVVESSAARSGPSLGSMASGVGENDVMCVSVKGVPRCRGTTG